MKLRIIEKDKRFIIQYKRRFWFFWLNAGDYLKTLDVSLPTYRDSYGTYPLAKEIYDMAVQELLKPKKKNKIKVLDHINFENKNEMFVEKL
jgi:hypothetical protein